MGVSKVIIQCRARLGCVEDLSRDAFYVAYIVYITVAWFGYTTLSESGIFLLLDNLVKIVVALLLVLRMLVSSKLEFRYWALWGTALLAAAIVSTTSGDKNIVWLVMFLASGKDVSIHKLARLTKRAAISILIVTVALCLCGIIPHAVATGGGEARYSFGFIGPNRFGGMATLILLCQCVERFNERRNPFEGVLAIALLALIHVVAHVRTCEVVIVAMTVLFYIVAIPRLRSPSSRRMLSLVALSLTALCVLVSLVVMLAYSPSNALMARFNEVLSGRLQYANFYFRTYGISLFGFDYSGAPEIMGSGRIASTFLVDNSFQHLLLKFGVVVFVLFVFLYCAYFYLSAKRCEFDAAAFGLLVMLLYGLAETNAIYIESNFCLVAAGAMVTSLVRGMRAEGDAWKSQ